VAELSGYVFETLRVGGDFVLSRGHKSGNADPILVLAPVAAQQSPANLRQLEHEYALASELHSAWAVRPVALARQNGCTMLVLEDTGGSILEGMLVQRLELTRFLRIAVSLTWALRQIHEHGLIHKHVVPGNILLDADDNVRLTGFGIASRLPRERQPPSPPEIIAGTFAYMAPEQTGRMNRSIDARSDLYSLGVTLYQMLTGTLPFTASDPMEWVHCHIARQPTPPAEKVEGIPDPVSAIVLKLLAKTAEQRYQTAAGLEADLRACLSAWQTRRCIDHFPLGLHDASDRLLIPEKLYGREPEIRKLVAAFSHVGACGTTGLVLVSGYAGIGKSSVVNELHKVLVPSRGLFAAGKFDQYKRDIPYATLAQAFRGLVRDLLAKSDAEVARWRRELLEALGQNGQLMLNLIPELVHIIGEQPSVPDLSSRDAQNRFQLIFRRFIGVFARPEHPLALFLDDLQWLDAATLELLERLATEKDLRHLLLVGAYRDNEVSIAHPLMRTLEAIRKAGARLEEIALRPLELDDLVRLLADTLHTDAAQVQPLAELVFEKTAGNPFFAIQFVTALAEEGLLTFAPEDRRWKWNMARIHDERITDNVAELMAGKLNRFSGTTQDALRHLACLGNSASTATLSIVLGASGEKIQATLSEPVRAGLVTRLESGYVFLHDRVQEAAYSLIPAEERAPTHWRIGRLLVAALDDADTETHIFEIVSQFNRSSLQVSDQAERELVATLNLRAGRRAKASAAYAAACGYLAVGAALLGPEGWAKSYKLAFALTLEHAECSFLNSRFDDAEALIATLLRNSVANVDFATVYRLKIELQVVKSENPQAIAIGLECLRLFGIGMSEHPTREQVLHEYDRIWRNLGGRSFESLTDLQPMTDPEMQAAMRVLAELIAPAYFTDFNLMSLLICQMVNLSLVHGATDTSIQGYAWLGWLLGPAFNRYGDGYRVGEFACGLVSRRKLPLDIARVNHTMGLTSSWTQPLTTSIDWFRSAFHIGVEAGDLYFACYSTAHIAISLLMRGDYLQRAAEECREFIGFGRKLEFRDGIDLIVSTERAIASLRGLTRGLSNFSDGEFDEVDFEAQLTGDRMGIVVYWYWTRKIMVCVLSGDYQGALAAAGKAQTQPWIKTVQIQYLDYHYYTALALAALAGAAPEEQRGALHERLATHGEQLRVWRMETGSPTFIDKHVLVSAEIARIEGRELDAMRLYEEAIHAAREHGFVQNEGIANEHAARFYSARGFQTTSDAYLRNARSCYLRWGADGKVRQLEQFHPQLREETVSARPDSTVGTTLEQLDLATVVKVAHAVSREIDLKKLIDALMEIALEHAGADRGLLILPRGDELRVEAEAKATPEGVSVRLRRAYVTATELPESILHYVTHTQDSVLLDDASSQNQFSNDEYIRRNHCRSILCLPLIKQAKLTGVLYIENNKVSHVFTPSRIAILRLLSSQAAISLENARLYADLQSTETYLVEAQRLSSTGSFGWSISSGEIFWSAETFQIFGIDPTTKPTLEKIYQRIDPRDAESVRLFLDRTPQVGRDWELEHRIRMPDGSVKSLHVVAHAVKDEAGELAFVGAVMDVTQSKQAHERLQASVKEKDALLKEVHHRVKNNLQLISSLLNLQAARTADAAVAERFADSRNRIRAMALVHENLYRAGNFARISMAEHIRTLCAHLIRAYELRGRRVELTTKIDDTELDLDRAVSVGLIVNELVSNALKHAFPGERTGRIRVELKLLEGKRYVLVVMDDGVGIPSDFDAARADSLGFQLVHDLARQLHGTVALSRECGTTFNIAFDAAGSAEAAE
jgi:predicted ATPase/two-component sensor histidine kinase